MANSLEKILLEYFPDATYNVTGINAGKWITDDYEFSLVGGYYKIIKTGKISFVNGGNAWNETLKLLIKKNSNHIGKG